MTMHTTLRPLRTLRPLTGALLIPFLLVACGGGGGSSNNGGGNTIPPSVSEEAQAILEDCAGEAATALTALIGVAQLGAGGASASITLEPLSGLAIPFQADLDGDMSPDALGRVLLFDAGGAPVQPQDPAQDLNTLLAQIAALPDGTRVDILLDPVASLGINSAIISQTMASGLPANLSAVVEHQNAECLTTLSFSNETLLSILGTYPNLDADIDIDAGTDELDGTVSFNGTSTAIIEVTLNGTGPLRYQLDVDSGTITPIGG